MSVDQDDTRTYVVVRNGEQQYSIWPTSRAVPAGWATVGHTGTRAECLAYIGEVWTDIRPLSARS
jgi:MbtH protein